MNHGEAKKALLAHWIVQWPLKAGGTQAAPTVKYALPNRKLAQPTPPFASVEIVHLPSDQRTMGAVGNRRFERVGRIDVRLFGPRDQGTEALDTLAEYVREIFEAKRIGSTSTVHGITTFATSINEVADKEYPELMCVLARTGFDYHQKR